MDVLVQLPLSEVQRARLEAAAPGARFEYVKPRTVTREQVEAADAIVGNVPTEMLTGASDLRLLQLNSAGYEQYAAPGVLPDGCALCCATGAYGQAVSEHLFAMVLSLVKRLPAYQDRQRAHDWCDLGPVTTLRGARVLVLGAGDIGTHLAGLCAAMASARARPPRTTHSMTWAPSPTCRGSFPRPTWSARFCPARPRRQASPTRPSLTP